MTAAVAPAGTLARAGAWVRAGVPATKGGSGLPWATLVVHWVLGETSPEGLAPRVSQIRTGSTSGVNSAPVVPPVAVNQPETSTMMSVPAVAYRVTWPEGDTGTITRLPTAVPAV